MKKIDLQNYVNNKETKDFFVRKDKDKVYRRMQRFFFIASILFFITMVFALAIISQFDGFLIESAIIFSFALVAFCETIGTAIQLSNRFRVKWFFGMLQQYKNNRSFSKESMRKVFFEQLKKTKNIDTAFMIVAIVCILYLILMPIYGPSVILYSLIFMLPVIVLAIFSVIVGFQVSNLEKWMIYLYQEHVEVL